MRLISNLYELFLSYLCRCRKSELRLLQTENITDTMNKANTALLFNEFHNFSANRVKTYKKGRLFTDRETIIDYFDNGEDYLRVLTVCVEREEDVDNFKKNQLLFMKKFDHILFVNNVGRDLGGYIIGLGWLKQNFKEIKKIFIANSSFISEKETLHRGQRLLDSEFADETTVFGCGYGFGPRYYLKKWFHLQSYCLFGSIDALSKYLSFSSINENKYFLIRNGEIQMSRRWLAKYNYKLVAITKNQSLMIVKGLNSRYKALDSRFDV